MQSRHWRKKPSDNLIKLMEDSVDLKLYLVQEKGPLCLTFQDDNGKKFQISIGNSVSCSCGGGKTEHCVHTLFTLNRVFKIAFNNPLILQLQFSDSELNKLLEEKNKKKKQNNNNKSKNVHNSKITTSLLINNTNQMSLIEDCICPICQEDLYTSEGLFYCENSCGHNFHLGCMRVFIKHKKDSDTLVTCPMCRAKWNEDEIERSTAGVITLRCVKPHKGINCANCSRSNIKFERFHCLSCDNYDICVECFSSYVHKDKGHNFIMKKTPEEKWMGCHYQEIFEINNNHGGNKPSKPYSLMNIYLGQFLTSCLCDAKNEDIHNNNNNIEENSNELNNNSSHISDNVIGGELRIQGENQNNNLNMKCSVCKTVTKTNKAMQFLMLKKLPNCTHVIHVRCCEKAFKILNYESHTKNLVVDKYFNKCRICNVDIFTGLKSIKLTISNQQDREEQNLISTTNQNRKPKTKSVSKRQLIQQIMMQRTNEENNFGLAFNIQKVNFNQDNDIQKFEYNLYRKNTYNERKIPYRQVLHKVKKVEPIVARNKEQNKKETKDIGDSFQVKKMPIMNSRPIRIENDHKVQLSPLLIDL